jgi:CarD family transcriptional regulator
MWRKGCGYWVWGLSLFRRGKIREQERIYMFEVQSKVVYGVVGVCEIKDISTPPIKGIDGDYYFLQPVYDGKGIIYSPVNSNKVLMRKVMTKKEADKIVGKAANCRHDDELNERVGAMHYDEMVKSQDADQLLHLIRNLYNIKNERAKELRKMKSADSRMLQAARKLLYGEIAVAREADFNEICAEMDGYLSQE